MCRVLKVSASGYYAWSTRNMSIRNEANQVLLEEIRRVYLESKKRYGAPRVYRKLKQEGIACGRHRVARLMREHGIASSRVKRFKCVKKSRERRLTVASNVLDRRFRVTRPNGVWASDITCFWTGSGWLHLAVVMDLFSRKIIGWAMGNRMIDELSILSLNMALGARRPTDPLLHHSDQGVQYTSDRFQLLLRENQIGCSMSRKGDCYDNAVIESFFKSLKAEIPWHRKFKTREEARKELFEYIEVFYNRKRLHSTLDYQSPADYERSFNQT
jgi:putative transposase